jgi:hypothetical protein
VSNCSIEEESDVLCAMHCSVLSCVLRIVIHCDIYINYGGVWCSVWC